MSPRVLSNHHHPTCDAQESTVNDVLNDSSDSVSNASYVSAIGSQEDFTLVDLHMQVCAHIFLRVSKL